MADALCGPSNALQTFQKHTSVDRTLQQDRLTSRQSPVQVWLFLWYRVFKLTTLLQGFRSHNPNAGILDHEFEAFEAGFNGPAPLEFQSHPALVPQAQQSPLSQQSESSGWATDFQKLRLSGSSHPIPQHQFRNEAPLHRSSPLGWHNDFMRQQQSSSAQGKQANRSSDQGYNAIGNIYNTSMTGYSSMNSMPMYQERPSEYVQQQTKHQEPVLDDAAFEEAFAQARAEIEQQEEAELLHTDLGHDTAMKHFADRDLPMDDQEQIRIGSDAIEYHDKDETKDNSDEGDELAKTAGQLLDSVSHDQSQKFRESSFLALMRRIRDREVKVDGDEFRDVSTAPTLIESDTKAHTPNLASSVNQLQFCPV